MLKNHYYRKATGKRPDRRPTAKSRNKLYYKLRPKFRMPSNRTLVLFEMVNAESAFFCAFDHDLSKFDTVYVNSTKSPINLQNELVEFFFDNDGKFKFPKLYKPTRNWEVFIKCGFIY